MCQTLHPNTHDHLCSVSCLTQGVRFKTVWLSCITTIIPVVHECSTVVQVALVAAQYEQLSFGKAIDAIQKVSARGNLFLQERQPWTAFKKVSTLCRFARCRSAFCAKS